MDEVMRWAATNSKDTLEIWAVIASLFFTAASFRTDRKERRISNLMAAAASHRDLWLQITEKPELARVLKADLNLKAHPVSIIEQRFVGLSKLLCWYS